MFLLFKANPVKPYSVNLSGSSVSCYICGCFINKAIQSKTVGFYLTQAIHNFYRTRYNFIGRCNKHAYHKQVNSRAAAQPTVNQDEYKKPGNYKYLHKPRRHSLQVLLRGQVVVHLFLLMVIPARQKSVALI